MSTTQAAITTLVCAGIALGLALAGGIAIYNTTDGEVQGGNVPELSFPPTPTGMLVLLDDDGALASLAVLALRPSASDEAGSGGSIVPVPVTADASGGFGDERLPLDETVELFGAGSLEDEVPALLGVSIDQVAVVERDELAAMLAPLRIVTVDLPAAVPVDGRELAGAGEQRLRANEVAAILSSPRPDLDGSERYAIDVALWTGVAAAVEDGLDEPLTIESGAESTALGGTSMGVLVELLTSGEVAVQPLRTRPIVSLDQNPRVVDALALDRVEVAVVFGHIAPGKMAAPNNGYNFRLVSPYSDEQLSGNVTRLDVAYTATKALLADEANVLSVDTVGNEAASDTIVEVNDATLVPAAERLAELFGPVDVRVGDTRIVGVDVTVRLGSAYLERLDLMAADDVAAAADRSPAEAATAADGDE